MFEKYLETYKSTQIDEENGEERKEIVTNENGKFKITIDIKAKDNKEE